MSHSPLRLKTRQRLVWSCVLGVAGALTIGVAQAQTRQPAPVFPVAPVVVAPSIIAIPGVGAGGATVATPNAVKASAVLSQVQVGALTAQQAWETGQLTVDDLVRAANAPHLFSSETTEDVRMREALVQLLVEHGQDRWMPVPAPANKEAETEKPKGERLGETARLAVADSLSKARDERAVAVYEDMLLPLERTRPSLRAVGALNHLGSFYWNQGKLQQAADVFMRGETYSSSLEWAAAIRLDAARVYTQMGNATKAKDLYDQIPQFGSGWITVLAFYDQALPLINAGKLEEAKTILSQDLQVKENPEIGLIAQNAWLASLAYRQGKLDEAMRHGQVVTQLGEKTRLPNTSVKSLYAIGREVYHRAGGWKTQPIRSSVKEVIIKPNPSQPDKPLYARFRIKTYGDTSVTATVDNPMVQVRVLPINNWADQALPNQGEESEVIIQVLNDYRERNESQKIILTLKSAAPILDMTRIFVTVEK